MKIAVAQIRSIEGEIEVNLKNHLDLIQTAITHKTDAIFFPELSLTGYLTSRAAQFTINPDDSRLAPLQTLADREGICIGAGVPLSSEDGFYIAMLIFCAGQPVTVKEKTLLHTDETPYFQARDSLTTFEIVDKKIGLGICYEALQAAYIAKVTNSDIDTYIASVSKDQNGVLAAYQHFEDLSKSLQIPILMSNNVGPVEGFNSSGNSAVWNKEGKLLASLDHEHQGIIILDTETESTHAVELNNPSA